jgi:hypothetical protein
MVDATGFLGTAYRDASIILQAIIEIPNSVFQSHTGPIRICSLIIQSAYDSHGNDLLKKYGKYLQSTTLVEDELIWVTDSKVDLSIKTNSIIATIKGSFDDEWEFFTDDCTLIVLNTFTALLIDDIKFEFSAIATSYVNNDPLISIQAAAPDPTHPEKHGNGFLWKPISESSGGKLVAILPPEFTPYAEYAHLRASLTGPVLETPWQTGIYNGDRKHSWFSKTGSGYPSGTWVVTQCQGRTWGWKITGNMGARHENEIPTVAGSDNNNGVYPQPPADEPVRGIT